jgi:predicted enzyme related to lactoylglutathione lyase
MEDSMKNPINWFEVYVQDMNRAKSFYESVFETSLTKLETPIPGMEYWKFPWVENGSGATGALVKMEGVPSGGNST